MEAISISNCPIEILCLIFKYLDTKALAVCMLVNRKWKNIAEYTVEYLKQWEDMVRKEMINKGSTFINKSTLDLRNIFKNSLLWNHVKMAEVKPLNVYKTQSVKKMHVYKDNLILVTNLHILYYDIKTYKLMKSFQRSCLDFEENDHTVVELVQHKLSQRLHLYRKSDGNEIDLEQINRNTVKDVQFYRLENELCYVYTTKNILWRLVNKVTRWEMEFVARHYGSDYYPMTTIHMYNELVFMVTKLGFVWHADTRNIRFTNVLNLPVPDNISRHNWVMFDRFSCAVPVTTDGDRVKINYDSKSDVMVLECSDLTCGLQHGDVLFLGFNDGTVEIRMPKKYNRTKKEPERYFKIQRFFENEADCAILGLNVYEAENSHILLVRTHSCVYQLQLTYPERLL